MGLDAALKFNPDNYRIMLGDEAITHLTNNFSKSVVVKGSSPLPAADWKSKETKLHSFHGTSDAFQAEIPIEEANPNAEEEKEPSEEVKTESEFMGG